MGFWVDNAWIICIVAGSSCITAGLQIWGQGSGPRFGSMAALMCALGVWSVGYGLMLHAPGLTAKSWYSVVQMAGIVELPPATLILGLAYQGRERLITPRNIGLIHLPALVVMALFLTNPFHHFIFSEVWLPAGSQVAGVTYGPGFWILIIAYPISVTVWFVIQALKAGERADGLEKRNLRLLLLALVPPHVGFALYYTYFQPRGMPDPSPVFFLGTALVVFYAVISRRKDEPGGWEQDEGHTEGIFKIQTTRSLAILAVPTITYFLVEEILGGEVFEAAILTAMLLITVVGMFIGGFKPTERVTRQYFSIGLAAFTVILGMLGFKLLNSSGEPGQVLWVLIFPLVALLAFGDFWGMIASTALLTSSALYAEAGVNPGQTLWGQFGLRLVVTYSVITLVFLIVDRKRRRFLARTREQRDALDMASRQWRRTFDAMGDAVCLLDNKSRIKRCNRAAAEYFGAGVQDIPGRTCYQLIHPGREPGNDCPQRAARETGTRQERVLQSGERWFREIADPIMDVGGAMVGFVHIISDITRQKRMEQETAWLNKQLALAQKRESLGIVAGGVAHDFNNLLNGILGYNDLAKSNLPPDSPAREHLDSISSLGMKAAQLTRKMLDYTGRGKRMSREVDISRLVEDMRVPLTTAVPVQTSLEFVLAKGLPPARVDSTQLSQALTNLVANAAEAVDGEGGRISVSTGAEVCDLDDLKATGFYEDQQPGVYLYLEVADNGPGLDPQILDRIFDPFFTTRFPGRGLGLATVMGVMRSHGGVVRVRNHPGKGAAFRLLLPQAEEEDLAKPAVC